MTEVAILGGGCFWCMEAQFNQIEGVLKVETGHTGGKEEHPTYEQVAMGETGHAEAIRVEFDPSRISYSEILEIFFVAHDPTSLNYQGDYWGTHFRSAIFAQNEKQAKEAKALIAKLTQEKVYEKPIVTTIEPAGTFWVAPAEHQNYFENNPQDPYCHTDISPKVTKIRQKFANRLKKPLGSEVAAKA